MPCLLSSSVYTPSTLTHPAQVFTCTPQLPPKRPNLSFYCVLHLLFQAIRSFLSFTSPLSFSCLLPPQTLLTMKKDFLLSWGEASRKTGRTKGFRCVLKSRALQSGGCVSFYPVTCSGRSFTPTWTPLSGRSCRKKKKLCWLCSRLWRWVWARTHTRTEIRESVIKLTVLFWCSVGKSHVIHLYRL